jgi:hypothetical protein
MTWWCKSTNPKGGYVGQVCDGVVTLVGTQTRRIRLCFPGSTSSTGGCRFTIVDPQTPAISSTTAALLPANQVHVVRVSPGQRVSAISNDAGTFSLSITELTD